MFEGCSKGGKRCMYEGGGVCPKSNCVAHGGRKRCSVPACGKSACGRTEFCKAHGGGKQCTFDCEKFARGRSGIYAAPTSSSWPHSRGSNRRMAAGA